LIQKFNDNYVLGLNTTKSLPGTFFIIDKHATPMRGDFVGFFYQGHNDYYPKDTIFVKIMSGVAGDEAKVRFNDNKQCLEYVVNDIVYGCIAEHSSKGSSLSIGPVGVIPEHYYAVRGTHVDSFDSRYGEVGWIKDTATIGKAYRLF
jgi:conjugal transfer pilin signal peptidase TrbI